jgi:hypothetical protein
MDAGEELREVNVDHDPVPVADILLHVQQEGSAGGCVRRSRLPAAAAPHTPSCQGWISGVALRHTLAQAGRPYEGLLAFGAAVRLGLPSHTPSRERPDCAMRASNRPRTGLSPSVNHPCPTHVSGRGSAPPSDTPRWLFPNSLMSPGTKTGEGSGGMPDARRCPGGSSAREAFPARARCRPGRDSRPRRARVSWPGSTCPWRSP